MSVHLLKLRGMGNRGRSGTLMLAIAVQAAIVAITVFVAVRQDAPAEPPSFSGERIVSVENQKTDTRQRIREMSRRMSKPRTFQPLAVEATFQSELPALPNLPRTEVDVSQLEDSLLAEQGSFSDESLSQWAAGVGNGQSATEFFGVKDSGRRIVIVVNTSASVVRKAAKRGVSIEQLQAETIQLVRSLEGGTVFGIVQFSQGTRSFSEFLAPALSKNKEAAGEWVEAELRGNPPVSRDTEWVGHEAAMAEALAFQPDLVFLVTDGSLNRRTPKAGGGYAYPEISFATLLSFVDRQVLETGSNPKLHVVGFELDEEARDGLQRLVNRFGGSLREM